MAPMQINDAARVANQMESSVYGFLPRQLEFLAPYISAAIIIAIGLLVAFIVRAVVAKAINATGFGRRAQTTGGDIGKSVGKAFFWLILAFAIYIALTTFAFLGDALEPLDRTFAGIGDAIPNIIAAVAIFGFGYVFAKVARMAVVAMAEAFQVDTMAARSGLTQAVGSTGNIASTLGSIVFVLIIVPVVIAAISALGIDAITVPLTAMLEDFVQFLPKLIGAVAVLVIFGFIARFVGNFLQNILPTFGFDQAVNNVMMLDDGQGMSTSPAKIAGTIASAIIIVLGLAAAVEILGIDSLSNVFGALIELGGRVLVAAAIVIGGVFLANLVQRIVEGATGSSMAKFLKYAIIVLVAFMALNTLSIGDRIVDFLFGSLAIGAGVAIALAFGLGGKDWAGKVLQEVAPPKKVAQGVSQAGTKVSQAATAAKRTTKRATTSAKRGAATGKTTTRIKKP